MMMTGADRPPQSDEFWRWMAAIGLDSMNPLDVSKLVQHARQEVMQRLEKLLAADANAAECQSAASALGTLTELARRVRPKS